jgi:hypothetical protein
LEVELTAAAQLEAEQEQSPPDQEPAVILDHGHKTSVGQGRQAVVELRPEVTTGFNEGLTQFYDLPALRRWLVE